MSNPLLEKFNTPFNTIPFDKIKPKHFEPAFEELFSSARIEIESIWKSNNAPTFENTLVALERSASRLGRIASVLYNLNVAETGKEIQEVTRKYFSQTG
jgi:Zn-dependent oligopeptidase